MVPDCLATPPVVLVTGATDGIGLTTARMLLERGARVIIHGRSEDRIEKAEQTLRAKFGDRVLAPARSDFASLADVAKMAESVIASGTPVDVLLNNAGIFEKQKRASKDGFELTFAVNYLAPFLLTHLLLASPKNKITRVVNVSSMVHGSGQIDLADLSFDKRRYEGYAAYAQSKLANVLFTNELARRMFDRKFSTNSLHPGVVGTKLLKSGFGSGGYDSLEASSATSVMLSLDDAGRVSSGKYFVHEKEQSASPTARDAALAKSLYEKSCALVGVAERAMPQVES